MPISPPSPDQIISTPLQLMLKTSIRTLQRPLLLVHPQRPAAAICSGRRLLGGCSDWSTSCSPPLQGQSRPIWQCMGERWRPRCQKQPQLFPFCNVRQSWRVMRPEYACAHPRQFWMQTGIALVLARCFCRLGSESDLSALSLSLDWNQDEMAARLRKTLRGPMMSERALNAGCANASHGQFCMQCRGGAELEPAWCCFRLGSVFVGETDSSVHGNPRVSRLPAN